MWLIVATIHTVAAFTGVWISGIITKERSAMIPIVGTAIWMGVILCCGILLYDSKLTYALPCILGNIMGAYLGYFVVLHRKNGTMGRRKRRR